MATNLIDTHCHINMMVKKNFDALLTDQELESATTIVQGAAAWGVTRIINVGTSVIESKNCLLLADRFENVFATIGVHPNDCTQNWKKEIAEIKSMLSNKKIVGIGECGIDRHYPDHNLKRQYDAFKAQIELALDNDLALVVHSRDAYDETLQVLEEYKEDIERAVMHCFSYDQQCADLVIEWGFMIGLGGTITYPRNKELREIAKNIPLESIVLETDAPFLPVQTMRGQQNNPKYIKTIAEYLAELREDSFTKIGTQTTKNACQLFNLEKLD